MVKKKIERGTIYQQLNKFLNVGFDDIQKTDLDQTKTIIRGPSPQDIERKALELQQKKQLQDKFFRTTDRGFQKALQYEAARLPAYIDYEGFEYYPLIATALDLFMEEATTIGDNGKMLNIYSSKERIKHLLEEFFYDIANVNVNLPFWTRNVVKYGDNFVLNYGEKGKGVTHIKQLVNYEIERYERIQDGKPTVKFKDRMTGDEFNIFEISHFRLLGDDKFLPYGSSVLNKVRRVTRQLIMAEDAMLTYRIVRAGEKKVFKIDVGNIDDDDIEDYVYKIATKFKRMPQVNPNSGQIDYRFNILGNDEDYFLPVRSANTQTGIDTLPGACLGLDTKIDLLDGRSLPLKEIIKEYEKNKELWSYSINPKSGEIVPGKITWAGVTRKNTNVLKLTLDNGETFICTPDHKFPLKCGHEKEAQNLKEGDSLWSLSKKTKKLKSGNADYEMIYDHNKNEWVYTHQMVDNYLRGGLLKEHVRHHIDFNRFNNNPNNLLRMKARDHFKLHYNHKIIKIEWLTEKQDTGTLTIDGNEEYHNFHNFALSCGVFTKNSNLDAIQDIEYLRDNLFTGLGIPKPFLSFQDASGGGKNMAQFDIRFTKKINRIQQAMIQELNKMAVIHLYLLGYRDEDLGNFTLTLTNPSTQHELLKAELFREKAQTYRDLTSTDSGIAPMSHTQAKRYLFNMTDKEIIEDLKQQKMEMTIKQELQDSPVVIKKSGVFKDIDARYGEEDVEDMPPPEGVEGEGEGLGGEPDLGGGPPMGGPGGGIEAAPGPPPADLGGLSERKMSFLEFSNFIDNYLDSTKEEFDDSSNTSKSIITEVENKTMNFNKQSTSYINEINDFLKDKKFLTKNQTEVKFNENDGIENIDDLELDDEL